VPQSGRSPLNLGPSALPSNPPWPTIHSSSVQRLRSRHQLALAKGVRKGRFRMEACRSLSSRKPSLHSSLRTDSCAVLVPKNCQHRFSSEGLAARTCMGPTPAAQSSPKNPCKTPGKSMPVATSRRRYCGVRVSVRVPSRILNSSLGVLLTGMRVTHGSAFAEGSEGEGGE
jgi:hypothetical protein